MKKTIKKEVRLSNELQKKLATNEPTIIKMAAKHMLLTSLQRLPENVDNWTTDDKLIAQNLVDQVIEQNAEVSDGVGMSNLTRPPKRNRINYE